MTFQGLPWEFDLLEADLEERYPTFSEGRLVAWGICVEAVENSWTEEAMVRGLDWQVRFYPPSRFKIPRPRPARWQTIKSCCVLVVVSTKQDNMNEARRIGRPACRSLLALLRRDFPTIEPDKLLWEGAIVWTNRKTMRLTAVLRGFAAAEAKSARVLHRIGLAMARVEVGLFPPQLIQALEWLSLARSAKVRSEKFMHLWLAALSLASFGASRRIGDMRRIRNYTKTMSFGVAGVRSELSIEDLNVRFGTAYKARNQLVHAADASLVTLELLTDLESGIYELIDFELAKLGMQIVHR